MKRLQATKHYMKNYLSKFAVLVAITSLLIVSCSKEETKTQSPEAARPTVPLQNGEVRIGNQVWMTKNLNLSRYRNGDPIPQVQDPNQWAALTTGAWCYYENNTANGPVYGKLYNWFAVNDPRGLAPIGFHVPSFTEWVAIIDFLGGGTVAGGKMKATGTPLWLGSNIGANNSSGFTGLASGSRDPDGQFGGSFMKGNWWSSSEAEGGAWCFYLDYLSSGATGTYYFETVGCSVRCLRD